MTPDRLHALFQFALAAAGEAEDWRSRELSAIHLLKYAYLADLEWARLHEGQTWTGVDWRFHDFGPWDEDAWMEIEPALRSVGAETRRVDFPKAEDDVVRYRLCDDRVTRDLQSRIPVQLRLQIKRDVHRFAADTFALLHHVYLTPPMLHAAPEEVLNFGTMVPEDRGDVTPEPTPEVASPLTVKQRRRRRETITGFGTDLRARLAARTGTASGGGRPPRYDDVFHEGVAWLDEVAGEPVPEGRLDGHLDARIWHSATRKVGDVQ